MLQRIVVEEVLNYAISNKGCQCQDKSKQLLFHIKREKEIGKSKIVETIYLRFSFFKKRSGLLIKTLIRVASANIRSIIIFKVLSINEQVKNKKKRIIKGL